MREMSLERPLPGKATFYHGTGCDHCLQIGYWGRTGIYELLPVDETIRELLLQETDATVILAGRSRVKLENLHTGLL